MVFFMDLEQCIELAQQLGGRLGTVGDTYFSVTFSNVSMASLFKAAVAQDGSFGITSAGLSVTVSVL